MQNVLLNYIRQTTCRNAGETSDYLMFSSWNETTAMGDGFKLGQRLWQSPAAAREKQ